MGGDRGNGAIPDVFSVRPRLWLTLDLVFTAVLARVHARLGRPCLISHCHVPTYTRYTPWLSAPISEPEGHRRPPRARSELTFGAHREGGWVTRRGIRSRYVQIFSDFTNTVTRVRHETSWLHVGKLFRTSSREYGATNRLIRQHWLRGNNRRSQDLSKDARIHRHEVAARKNHHRRLLGRLRE